MFIIFSNLRSLSIYRDKKLTRPCLHYFKSIEKAVKYYKLNYSIPAIFQFCSVQLLLLESEIAFTKQRVK